MSRHQRSEAQVVIDVVVAIEIAEVVSLRLFHKDRIRIVRAIIAGNSQRNALQIFLMRLRRLGRAAHKCIEFFLQRGIHRNLRKCSGRDSGH